MFLSLWSIGAAVSPAPSNRSPYSAPPTTSSGGPVTTVTVPITAPDAGLARALRTLNDIADPYHSDQLACGEDGCPIRAMVKPQPVAERVVDFMLPLGGEPWRSLASAYFRPADVERALLVIGCESNGDPNAKNPDSTASGLFQHLTRYWPTRAEAAGFAGASVFDPRRRLEPLGRQRGMLEVRAMPA
jgi:hypothetical protein